MSNSNYVFRVAAAGKNPVVAGDKRLSLRNIIALFTSVLSGQRAGSGNLSVVAESGAVAASGTITLASCAADTVVRVNGVNFIAISGTPTVANNEFDISGTDAADATSLAAAINNSTSAGISGVVTATSTGATGVVTVTSSRAGPGGNAVTITTQGILANAVITAASVSANDTVTLNGTVLTAKQQRATATLTAATAIATNTFAINGLTFVGVAAAVTTNTLFFDTRTSDTACGNSISAQINSYVPLNGVVTATNVAGVVTVRAVTAGTGGNAITLAGTVTTLAASAATLGGGAAVANNEFEAIGTDTQVAADFVRAVGASSTAAVSGFVTATNVLGVITVRSAHTGTRGNNITVATSNGTRLAITGSVSRLANGTLASSEGVAASAIVTCASVSNADTVTINGVVLTAHTNTDAANQFAIDGNDTVDGDKLVLAINNSTSAGLKEVFASNSSGAVTITARRGGISGNCITIATSNGTRLAITGSLSRLGSGAVPTTVATSGDRLASGTSTSSTFSF